MNLARFFSLFFALTVSGCFVWSGVDPKDGGPDGGDVVITKVVPDRPPADTSSPDDDGEMIFAGYDVEMIQEADRWPHVGLNLDGVETYGPDDPHPCLPTRDGQPPAPDGVDGIDNQYGAAISPSLSVALPTAVCELTGSHFNGKGTFVAGIEKWNGEANDAQVTAWIIAAVGAMPSPETGEEITEGITWEGDRGLDLYYNGEHAPLPCYDGNDHYYLNPDVSVMSPADPTQPDEPRRPRIYDANAYIVDNVVVARIPANQPLTLMSVYRSLPARINDGYIVAKLSDDRTRIEESTLAGRFRSQDILDIAGHIGSCSDGLLSTFSNILNRAADLMLDPGRDHQGEVCDAISVGIPFKAVRAKLASEHGPAWPPDIRCDLEDEWDDEGVDHPKIYGCLGSGSRYRFQRQWDDGLMDHCTNGTLIPDIETP
jgi:hypothetical protein